MPNAGEDEWGAWAQDPGQICSVLSLLFEFLSFSGSKLPAAAGQLSQTQTEMRAIIIHMPISYAL